MQNDLCVKMSNIVIDSMVSKAGKRFSDFVVNGINEDVNNKSFTVEFVAFNYFNVAVNYNKGRLSTFIINGNKKIKLSLDTNWWEEADIDEYVDEIKEELKLRIPDKFLIAKEWK